MIGLLYVVTVLTPWGQRISNEGVLIVNVSPQVEDALSRFALLLNPVAIALMVLVLALIGWRRGQVRMGIACGVGMLIAILAGEILKRALPRPDLAEVTNPLVGQANSLPSGTAVITTSFVIGLVSVCAARWRPWVAAIGGMVALIFMTAAFLANWHRLPDLLAGISLAFGVMGIAWWVGTGPLAESATPDSGTRV